VQVCKLKALKLDLKKLNEEGFGNVVMHKKDLLDGIHELDTIKKVFFDLKTKRVLENFAKRSLGF
jgi:hypothetical protein